MTKHMETVLSLLQKGDPVKGRGLGKCALGKFHRIYTDKVGHVVVEYFCNRSKHAHGVTTDNITSIIPLTKLKARKKDADKAAAKRKRANKAGLNPIPAPPKPGDMIEDARESDSLAFLRG